MLTYFSASTAGKTFTPAFCMAWKKMINHPITTGLQNSNLKSFGKNAHGITVYFTNNNQYLLHAEGKPLRVLSCQGIMQFPGTQNLAITLSFGSHTKSFPVILTFKLRY